MLFAFVFGIDISQIISKVVENWLEKHEENKERREELKQQRYEEIEARRVEMMKQRKEAKKHREEQAEIQNNANHQNIPEHEQIKINLNGRAIEEPEEKGGFSLFKNKSMKKEKNVDHSVAEMANSIDTNSAKNNVAETSNQQQNLAEDAFFTQEEQQKEDKTKQVLQLQHTLVVEEDNYVYPSINLLQKSAKKALKGGTKALQETASRLQRTLYSFGVQAKVENVSVH